MNRRVFTIACATLAPVVALLGLPGTAFAGHPQADDCAASLVLNSGISLEKAEDVCDGEANDPDGAVLDDCVASLVQNQGVPAGRAKGLCDGSDPAD
jgi:hypothetical protein